MTFDAGHNILFPPGTGKGRNLLIYTCFILKFHCHGNLVQGWWRNTNDGSKRSSLQVKNMKIAARCYTWGSHTHLLASGDRKRHLNAHDTTLDEKYCSTLFQELATYFHLILDPHKYLLHHWWSSMIAAFHFIPAQLLFQVWKINDNAYIYTIKVTSKMIDEQVNQLLILNISTHVIAHAILSSIWVFVKYATRACPASRRSLLVKTCSEWG